LCPRLRRPRTLTGCVAALLSCFSSPRPRR
jgi:hypothetical protein